MHHYALTLRKTANPNFVSEYETFLKDLYRKYDGIHIEHHFEDSAGVHLHAYLVYRRKIYVNKIHPNKGWNLDLTPLKEGEDCTKWISYIRKDNNKEIDLINTNYKEERAFLDYQEAYKEKAFQEDFCEACNLFQCDCYTPYNTVDITKNVFAQLARV